MNSIMLAGNVASDIVVRSLPGEGKYVGTFNLAVDRGFKKDSGTDYFRITVWNGAAVNFEKHVRKGDAVTVRGHVRSGKYDKAFDCLTKDREALLAFFDFPAEHWDHLRTSNPIESVFATVRHRTIRTKGALSAKTAKLMVFKLVNAAAKTWRRLKGENQLPKVVQGVRFQNGIEVVELTAHHAA